MTVTQALDQAERDFRDHCKSRFEAGTAVYGRDAAAIERIAKAIAKAAEQLAADIRDSHALELDYPPSELAQRLAEAIDDLGSQEASALMYAQVRYLTRGKVPA